MRANPVVALWVALTLLLGSLAVAIAPREARAADRGKAEAKKLLGQGDSLFAKKKYAEALTRYQKAYEAFPSPQIFYPMAQTEEKLGREIEAILHYEQLIADAPGLKPELRAEAEDRVKAIERRLAVVSLTISPVGSVISVDEIEVGAAPLERPLRLKPGSHALKISKAGYKPQAKTLELKAGARAEETFALTLEGSGPVDVAERDPGLDTGGGLPETPPPPPASHRRWLKVGLVATGVLAAGATVTGFMARSKHATYDDVTKPIEEREDARAAGKTLALATDGLLVGTVLAAGFSTYWYFAVVKPGERIWTGTSASQRPSLLAPYVGADEAGFSLSGAF